jgi:hypothetical protein
MIVNIKYDSDNNVEDDDDYGVNDDDDNICGW